MRYKTGMLFSFLLYAFSAVAQNKLHVVIAGLSHDHVTRILDKNRAGEMIIVGITEADKSLAAKKQAGYQLPDSIFFKDLATAIKRTKPDLVMAFNAPSEHLPVAQVCLPLHIPVMFEKPLCFSLAEAKKMEALSKEFNTKVFTNFPSFWYTGFMELLERKSEIADINKMIMRGGHRGPKDIGCSKEFVNWLTDPIRNGGGAVTDFGCYGASIMTALMDGKKPVSVYAVARTIHKAKYPNVDDDATIVLEYAGSVGIIDASWNLPYTIMEVEVFAGNGYYHASEYNAAGTGPFFEIKNNAESKMQKITAPEYNDEIAYLTDVIKNKAEESNKLMSLEYNVVIVSILDAARKSAKTGKKNVL